MRMFKVRDLIHKFRIYTGEKEETVEKTALSGLTFEVDKGQFIGILGRNGSGKSTLAKHLCGLLKPTGGIVLVNGMDSRDPGYALDIRKTAGMVFQNPDNQLVGTSVEEDVAFGPENLGMDPEEMDSVIERVLSMTGMSAYRYASPHELSGGQKQKIAVSGILAMEPECIIFDEPTAMMDPAGCRDLAKIIRLLNRKKGITILYITHHLEEVVDADYLYIMEGGHLFRQGRPADLLSGEEGWNSLSAAGISPLPGQVLMKMLKEKGITLPDQVIDEEALVSCLKERIRERNQGRIQGGSRERIQERNRVGIQERSVEGIREEMQERSPEGPPVITLESVSYSYPSSGQDRNPPAIDQVSTTIRQGEIVALIGAVGAGKSTFLMTLNALLKPSAGRVLFCREDIWDPSYSRKELRQKLVLCFQNPEAQLFEETLLLDVAFGPRNMGRTQEEACALAREAMKVMGLPGEYEDQSPFMLSGGEKRRAAIAGLLAMEPEVLVLDEPAAGLDADGVRTIFDLLKNLRADRGMTILFTSHSMEDAAEYADRVLVLEKGRLILDGSPEEVFNKKERLRQAGLDIPWAAAFAVKLYGGLSCESDDELCNGRGSWKALPTESEEEDCVTFPIKIRALADQIINDVKK